MLQCKKCNKELDKDSKFCIFCGEIINVDIESDKIKRYKDWSYSSLFILPINIVVLFVLHLGYGPHVNPRFFIREQLSYFFAYAILALVPVFFTAITWVLFLVFKKKLELPIKGAVIGSIIFTAIFAVTIMQGYTK